MTTEDFLKELSDIIKSCPQAATSTIVIADDEVMDTLDIVGCTFENNTMYVEVD